MKKLFILLVLIGLLASCTLKTNADLDVKCPCVVGSVEYLGDYYKVTFQSQSNIEYKVYPKTRTFSFYTKHKYNVVGDTIK